MNLTLSFSPEKSTSRHSFKQAKGLPPSFAQLPGDACLATENNGCQNDSNESNNNLNDDDDHNNNNNDNNNNNNGNNGNKNKGIFSACNNYTIMHTKFPEDLNLWFVSSPAVPPAAQDQPSPRVQAHQGHVAMPKNSSALPTDPLIARLPLLDQAVSPRRACDDAEAAELSDYDSVNEHTASQIGDGGESPSLLTQQSLPRSLTPQTSIKNHSNSAIHPTLASSSSSSASSLSGMLLRDTRAPQSGAAMTTDLGDHQASLATRSIIKDPGHMLPSLQSSVMASGSGPLINGGVMRRILYPPDGGGLRPVSLPLRHPHHLSTVVARNLTAMPLPSMPRMTLETTRYPFHTRCTRYTVYTTRVTCIMPPGPH
jgi:hypothetical protein